jgi:hypothetical protein
MQDPEKPTESPNPSDIGDTSPVNPPRKGKKRPKRRLQSLISDRWKPIDKIEAYYTIDPDREDLEHLSDEEIDRYLDNRPVLTPDEFVDRVLARKEARRAHAGANTSRPRNTPKSLRPQCGAKTRAGGRCRAKPVWDKENNRPRNGRCRMHGGLSTGPKTPEGKAKALSKLKQNRGRE